MTHIQSDPNCVFCKIISGELPTSKVYEDDSVLAFLDIGPVHKGQVLVIPKDHFENVYTVPTELWCRVQIVVQKVAVAVKNALSADGINILMNNESSAGQMIDHAHVHVIPRENEDGLTHWPTQKYDSLEDKDAFAKKIAESL